jgi:hypothetical protein
MVFNVTSDREISLTVTVGSFSGGSVLHPAERMNNPKMRKMQAMKCSLIHESCSPEPKGIGSRRMPGDFHRIVKNPWYRIVKKDQKWESPAASGL